MLRCLKLLPRTLQGVFILFDRLFLNFQLFSQERQLRRQPRNAGVHVLDACRGQSEPALGEVDLPAEGGNGSAAGVNGSPGCVPVGLGQPQGLIAAVDFGLRLPHARLGHVEVRVGLGHRIRSVLGHLSERSVLPGELLHLLHGGAVLALERIQIGLRRDGCGVGFAKR